MSASLFDPVVPSAWPENGDGWTVQHLDWSDPANQDQRRELQVIRDEEGLAELPVVTNVDV